jgi:hypothetical protein
MAATQDEYFLRAPITALFSLPRSLSFFFFSPSASRPALGQRLPTQRAPPRGGRRLLHTHTLLVLTLCVLTAPLCNHYHRNLRGRRAIQNLDSQRAARMHI